MSKLWTEQYMFMKKDPNERSMQMITYDVMETGFETGFIQFVDESETVANMQVKSGLRLPSFREHSLMQYFMKNLAKNNKFTDCTKYECEKRLENYRYNFLRSLAG